MTPFDYVTSVTQTKKYIDDLTDYDSFIVNRSISYHYDTILDASLMNLYSSHMNKKMQYDYYYHKLKAKKRYGYKWPKTLNIDENLKLIMNKYKYSLKRAREIKSLFSQNDLDMIKEKQKTGGVDK